MDLFCCCCCLSEEEKENLRISQEIEKQLTRDKNEFRREIKLLLLGTGESGKSTLIKQMRIIHGAGYTLKDRIPFIGLIHRNIFEAMHVMVEAMDCLSIPYASQNSEKNARTLRIANYHQTDETLGSELGTLIGDLWKDEGVKECYKRRKEFQLPDSAFYYFTNIKRISGINYAPTLQDILRVRQPTTGIIEYDFEIKEKSFIQKSSFKFRLVDVGGQRSERRKWIHCFQNVASLLFVVAISEFDQTLLESTNVNRMKESLALFKSIIDPKKKGATWFEGTPVILFMNKKDIFEEKIITSDIATYFPEYKGTKGDLIEAQHFILSMFEKIYTAKSKSIAPMYSHFTTATDTENINFVFAAASDFVLRTNLNLFNLY